MAFMSYTESSSGFNRTFMELKYNKLIMIEFTIGVNRTFMELKSENKDLLSALEWV